jgi:hypothetical protein
MAMPTEELSLGQAVAFSSGLGASRPRDGRGRIGSLTSGSKRASLSRESAAANVALMAFSDVCAPRSCAPRGLCLGLCVVARA